ncbi:MAG: hypothetical protein RBR82_14670 [Pseudomonas sp.]|nr:hypothetical protein [Pseudomonas sp.]
MSDVILKALKDMSPTSAVLLDRAYAAGHRAGQRAAEYKAATGLAEGLAVARAELSLSSLSERVDALADTVNDNFAIIAEALGSVLIDPDEGLSEQEAVEFVCQLHDDGELPAFVEHCRKQHEQG